MLYRALTGMSAPVLNALLSRRVKRGKEDPARLSERRGVATQPRPPGFLVWIHAISIGEAMAVLPLIEALLARPAGLSILLTTGTLTSAQLMAERLPSERVLHQFAPLDQPDWVARFLTHWQPDLGLITESELWPNLILGAKARRIPLILINARISARTTQNWLRFPRSIGTLLGAFTLCLAQDQDTASRLYALGAEHVATPGNLKFAAKPLPDQPEIRAELEAALIGRPRWLAASTHPGEEEKIAEAHQLLRTQFPNLLTIIAPRHPARGAEIAAKLVAQGLITERRAQGDAIGAGSQIYLADTLGELGVFYRLAPVVFLGGTLVPIGGQNPLEPARLGATLLHGPHTDNFADIFRRLDRAGGAERIETPQKLALAVGRLLQDQPLRQKRAEAALGIIETDIGVLPRMLTLLTPYLPEETALATANTPISHAPA
jgi:3-deoxy-D-manno-octulosonic-acid transferase